MGDIMNRSVIRSGTSAASSTTIFVACLAMLCTSAALAQSNNQAVLEEIIVTATKRDASIQDLALSVSAISGSDLEDQVAVSFADYTESVPGLAYNGNEPGNDKLIIRGISTDGFNSQLQSTVGVYIDDMPGVDVFIPTSSPDLHMFDVNRVEVLRGPQGTLWGSSSMGGALRIITNRPNTTETEFRTRLTVSDVADGGTGYGVDALANFPLVQDEVALRLTAYSRTDAGYLDDVNLGRKDNNETTVTGGRASLRWLPSDSLTVDLTATYQKIENDGGGAAWLDNPIDPTQAATTADRLRFNYTADTRKQELTMANLVIEKDFGDVQFVSSTTVGDGDLQSADDQTPSTSVLAFLFSPPGPLTTYEAQFFNKDTSSTVTQEFRLVSDDPDSALSWLVGAFYLDNDRELRSNTEILTNVALHPFVLFPGNNVLVQDLDTGRTEKAIFGEATWHASDRVDVTIGARYFENDQFFNSSVAQAFLFPVPIVPTVSETSDSDSNFKFSIAFRPNDDVMLYALASQGFRLGGTNAVASAQAPTVAPAEYGSDTLWNYELGARTTFNGGRSVLNATAFYIDWSDFQTGFTLDAPFFTPFFANAGDASSKGIELEFSTQIGENWYFRTAMTSQNAEVESTQTVLGATTDIVPGDALPGSPEFQSSASLEYATTIAGRETTFAVNHLHVGESNYHLTRDGVQGDYDVFGLLIRSALSDNVNLSLFAKNLGDEDGVTLNIAGIPGFFQERRYLIRPRTIGLSLQVNF